MAKRRKRAASAAKVIRVGAPRAAAPIIKVSAPRAAPVRRRRRGGRRRSNGMSIAGLAGGPFGGLVGNVLGGAIVGFATKQGYVDKLPEIPVIGRMGAMAIGLHYFARHGGGTIARQASMAAGCIAGYQLGSEGHIHGYDASPDGYEGYGATYDDEYADGP